MKKLRVLLALVLGLWLALLVWIDRSGQRVDLQKVDCIVILGSRALADGTPGDSLKARTDRAVQLYREGWASAIVCTGGRGQSGSVESEAARAYAVGLGVPAHAVLQESESHNTRENFAYAAPMMLQRGWKRCLIVTDPFHEPRALALARDYDLEPYPAPSFGGPATLRLGSRLYYTVRESLSWLKYSLQRLTGAGKRKEAPLARVPSNMEEPEYPVGFGVRDAARGAVSRVLQDS
jgi:uncharacterized SAM-binding protein YcdF (DUF218 family)